MNQKGIATFRLNTQQLLGTKHKTAKELVQWMGAIQAQDYPMAKWALGNRLLSSTDKLIEEAINKGDIIRTHLLRPTWHLAAKEDVRWMLELSSPQIKTLIRSANKQLELTQEVFSKSNSIIEKALSGGNHLTREELAIKLEAAKINTQGTRGIHLFLQAEMDGIICSGAMKANKITYALFDERIPKAKSIKKEEALEKLAQRYFLSHAPATLKDFYWWSGLPMADTKKALELVKKNLISERVGEEEFWFPQEASFKPLAKQTVHLLPAFDEYLISYKSRNVSILSDHQPKAFTTNGIFKPIIVINGQVGGIWKRTIKKDKVFIETDFFDKPAKSVRDAIEKEVISFGKFLGLEAELRQQS